MLNVDNKVPDALGDVRKTTFVRTMKSIVLYIILSLEGGQSHSQTNNYSTCPLCAEFWLGGSTRCQLYRVSQKHAAAILVVACQSVAHRCQLCHEADASYFEHPHLIR